ncbi:MAG: histidine kinase [Saprospiraceae bacterium]
MIKRKKIRELLGFNDLWLALIGVPVISFIFPILFFKATVAQGFIAYLPKWGISFLYTIMYWVSVRWLIVQLRCKYPSAEHTGRRILYSGASIIGVFFLVNFIMNYVERCLGQTHEEAGISEFDMNVASFTVILLVTAIYESIFFYAQWKKALVETEQLKRANIESQLEGLKSQVNPHFLFNSLNTLTYVIPEDPERAVLFVRQLSKVYRYILEIREKQLIPLAEELNFMKSYLFLIKERFGDNLCIRKAIPDEYLQDKIVPLSLQMLLENCVKHNIISKQRPLEIDVYIEHQCLIVRNTLQRKHQERSSTRVGLQNIRNRYAFFTREEVKVEETDGYFQVSLPLIKS